MKKCFKFLRNLELSEQSHDLARLCIKGVECAAVFSGLISEISLYRHCPLCSHQYCLKTIVQLLDVLSCSYPATWLTHLLTMSHSPTRRYALWEQRPGGVCLLQFLERHHVCSQVLAQKRTPGVFIWENDRGFHGEDISEKTRTVLESKGRKKRGSGGARL